MQRIIVFKIHTVHYILNYRMETILSTVGRQWRHYRFKLDLCTCSIFFAWSLHGRSNNISLEFVSEVGIWILRSQPYLDQWKWFLQFLSIQSVVGFFNRCLVIQWLIDWLIDWCLTTSEQFFSYIQDNGYSMKNLFYFSKIFLHTRLKLFSSKWAKYIRKNFLYCDCSQVSVNFH